MEQLSDIEIAQAAQSGKSDLALDRFRPILPISQITKKLGIGENDYEPYGRYKAKLSYEFLETLKGRSEGALILVTAMSPTPAGEGKTTTTVGLGDALTKLGKKTMICLREPSLGPVFGMKGGAAGGGYSQVIPMEDINLHFTGDFNAIQLAHNLLSALIDNHLHHGTVLDNGLQLDPRRVTWKRVLDMNDRALREIIVGLGGRNNGVPREDGFDIVVASEVMAIFCLATSLNDLKERLGKIVVGHSTGTEATSVPICARDLKAHGAMSVLLKDAFKPNLVQSLYNTPALIHGGPFANIAHGCNSVIATKTALKLADYVVTEAGFGADLGAEKFVNIKCRKSGLKPQVAVIVATVRALKFHGGVELAHLKEENLEALKLGFCNLERHIRNVTQDFGMSCVVSLNHFTTDTDSEIDLLKNLAKKVGVELVVAKNWELGAQGAEELAKAVLAQVSNVPAHEPHFIYQDSQTLLEKIEIVAKKIYGAAQISVDANLKKKIQKLQAQGHGHFPICMAKTQYSFSTDPQLRGAPSGHTVQVRDVRLAAGAEFIVVICGEIMTMPGLPKVPSACKIDLDQYGNVVGLF